MKRFVKLWRLKVADVFNDSNSVWRSTSIFLCDVIHMTALLPNFNFDGEEVDHEPLTLLLRTNLQGTFIIHRAKVNINKRKDDS